MTRRDDDQVDEQQPIVSTEPTAVVAAEEADRRDDLPDAGTDTEQAEKDAGRSKGRSSK